jgi:hypothetical protein
VHRPTKIIAACLGLAAFAVAVISGLASGSDPARTLTVALASMLICQCVGLAIGAAASTIVDERVAAYKASNPIPSGSSIEVGSSPEKSTSSADLDTRSRPAGGGVV